MGTLLSNIDTTMSPFEDASVRYRLRAVTFGDTAHASLSIRDQQVFNWIEKAPFRISRTNDPDAMVVDDPVRSHATTKDHWTRTNNFEKDRDLIVDVFEFFSASQEMEITLMAMEATLSSPIKGTTLIIRSKSVIYTWVSGLRLHYNEEGLTLKVLEDPEDDLYRPSERDSTFVFSTYGFVASRHCPYSPYSILSNNKPCAIKTLTYRSAIVMSGNTASHNDWLDAFGLFYFLPGCAFLDRSHTENIFRRTSTIPPRLQGGKIPFVQRYFMPITIFRPRDIIDLPIRHVHQVDSLVESSVSLVIVELTAKFVTACRLSDDYLRKQKDRKSFAMCAHTQALAANRLLVRGNIYGRETKDGDILRESFFPRFELDKDTPLEKITEDLHDLREEGMTPLHKYDPYDPTDPNWGSDGETDIDDEPEEYDKNNVIVSGKGSAQTPATIIRGNQHVRAVRREECREKARKSSTCLDTIRKIRRSYPGEKIIVFSTSDRLVEGMTPLRFDGSTPAMERNGILRKFRRSSGTEVLFLAAKARTFGLNLEAASHGAVDAAIRRAARPGQKRDLEKKESFGAIIKPLQRRDDEPFEIPELAQVEKVWRRNGSTM
ncbi:hypothetical protein F4776DRAFT_657730 [Hypoxylon sp. NC0597]|nr:hypothetical protein F4776DRAFT_657730 [Hypoxylon sp. NC0597]